MFIVSNTDMQKFRTRASLIVLHNEKLLGFLGKDPQSGKEYFFLPGGQVEPHESAPESAVRECLEETGFQAEVIPSLCVDKEYPFHWNGEDYDCLTLFYGGRLKSFLQHPRPEAEPRYNLGVQWISLEAVPERLNYCQEILEATLEIIGKLKA